MQFLVMLVLGLSVSAQLSAQEAPVAPVTSAALEASPGQKSFGVELNYGQDLTTKVKSLEFTDTQYDFDSSEKTGLSSLNFYFHIYSQNLDYSFGLKQTLSKNVGSSGTSPDSWGEDEEIDSQKLEMLGARLINIGWTIPYADKLNFLAGGGINIYHGKNVVKMGSMSFGGTNEITLEKVLLGLEATGAVTYAVTDMVVPVFSLGLELPKTLSSNLKQDGAWQYFNMDDELEDNLEFKNGFGLQAALGLALVF